MVTKKFLKVLVCLFITHASFGQSTSNESSLIFQFISNEDMLYVPYKGNEITLDSICKIIESYPTLENGIIQVDGYYPMNLPTAKIRSNRVKSAIITKTNATESNFTTRNHIYNRYNGQSHIVVVRLPMTMPDSIQPEMPTEMPDTLPTETEVPIATITDSLMTDSLPMDTLPYLPEPEIGYQQGDYSYETRQFEYDGVAEVDDEAKLFAELPDSYTWSIHTNLLRWAVLTPNVGIEYRTESGFSFMVGGSFTHLNWKHKERTYRLWETNAEIRYYLGHWYVGAEAHIGKYNYKFGENGYMGDISGVGFSGGYTFPVNQRLWIDFNLGLGYANLDYDKYTIENGYHVRIESKEKNMFDLSQTGISLVWTLNKL